MRGRPRHLILDGLVWCQTHSDVHDAEWSDPGEPCDPAGHWPVYVGLVRHPAPLEPARPRQPNA